MGDVAMILGGLVFGFWIRFRSGWINWGNEPAGLEFVDYSGLMGLGATVGALTFAASGACTNTSGGSLITMTSG